MKKQIWLMGCISICLTQSLFSQVNYYGFMDGYFGDVLFPNISYPLVSTKVNLPGLAHSSDNSVSVGVLPNYRSGWQGLYGWGDWKNGPGRAGVYLGNLDVAVHSPDHDHTFEGAFWITPFRHLTLKGISFTIDSEMDHTESRESADPYRKSTVSNFHFSSTALVKLTNSYHLRAGIEGDLHSNEYISIYSDETTWASQRNERKERSTTGTAIVGLVDKEGRRLDLSASGTVSRSYSSTGYTEFSLDFTDGKKVDYLEHALYYGVKAGFDLRLRSEVNANTSGYEYMTLLRNIGNDRILSGSIYIPVILDMKIYESIRAVLSVTPGLYTRYIIEEDTDNRFIFRLPYPGISVGIRGSVGRSLEWYLKPDLQSNVFASVAEVKYVF
ncbi:MAG: hypothetical protein ACOCXC_01045 [Fibrobacterota bacterium]